MNDESKIKKIFTEEVRWIITISTIIGSAIVPFMLLSSKVDLVAQRVDVHIAGTALDSTRVAIMWDGYEKSIKSLTQ